MAFAGIATLMILAGLYILSQPVDPGDFESTTGVAWNGFAADNPEVAEYLEREARLLGVSFAGLGVAGLAVALQLLRTGNRAGWTIAWFIPLVLVAAAIVFYTGDGAALGTFYGVIAFLAAAVVWWGGSTARSG